MAHIGFSGKYPENTEVAFLKAIAIEAGEIWGVPRCHIGAGGLRVSLKDDPFAATKGVRGMVVPTLVGISTLLGVDMIELDVRLSRGRTHAHRMGGPTPSAATTSERCAERAAGGARRGMNGQGAG